MYKKYNMAKSRLHACMLSCVQLFATLRTVAHQTPWSMGFLRQEYWNGLSFPPPVNFPDWGIKPVSLVSPALQVDSLSSELPGKPQSRIITY